MISFFPQNDEKQTLRIKRFLMAAGTYFVWVGLFVFCSLQGLTRASLNEIIICIAIMTVFNFGLYSVYRTGINKKFRDPSLTMVQLIVATLWCMLSVYYTFEVRSLMLLLYLVVFVFGLFRLRVMQFLFLSVFAVVSYMSVILLLQFTQPEFINPQIDMLNIIVLATVLPWFSLVGGYITNLRKDIAKALSTIEKLAITDDLTQVYNRREMFRILDNQKALAERGSHQFSICIFDLDDFKKVNDTYGHEVGDIVLVEVARQVGKNLRDVDQLARYGGEEFIIILPDADIRLAMVCAERVHKMVKTICFDRLPENFRVTISAGVTEYINGESIQETINRADRALYRAKASGRDHVEYENP